MSDRLRELLWKRLDAELSSEERRWLEDRLASDPDARREAEAVAKLAEKLEEVPEVEPPAALRGRIEAALAAGVVRPSPQGAGGWLSSIFGGSAQLRLAYLAAGLVLGAVGYHVVLGVHRPWSPQDLEGLYGAIVRPEERAAEALEVPLAGDAGTVALWRRGSTLLVELTLRGVGDAELSIGGEAALSALAHDSPSAPDVRHDARGLRVTGIGDGRLVLATHATDPGAPLEIVVSRAGEVLGRAHVSLADLAESSAGTTNFFIR